MERIRAGSEIGGMKVTLTLTGEVARKAACRHVLAAPDGYIVSIKEPTRTLSQNAAQWPLLDALSKQAQWSVNGEKCFITPEDWKDILTCAFRNESPRIAMGYNGGMVLLGQRTSKFKKSEFSEWMDFLWSVIAEKEVTVYEDSA